MKIKLIGVLLFVLANISSSFGSEQKVLCKCFEDGNDLGSYALFYDDGTYPSYDLGGTLQCQKLFPGKRNNLFAAECNKVSNSINSLKDLGITNPPAFRPDRRNSFVSNNEVYEFCEKKIGDDSYVQMNAKTACVSLAASCRFRRREINEAFGHRNVLDIISSLSESCSR